MIGLARSESVKSFMQKRRGATRLAKQFVAGTGVQDGVSRAQRLLDEHGIRSSLFYLGEYLDVESFVTQSVTNKHAIAAALGQAGLDVHVSIDPTQVGQRQNAARCKHNVSAIAQTIARVSNGRPGVHCAMLDMEDEQLIEPTIALHNELRAAGLPVALTLQAYLRRTETDLLAQTGAGAHVRMVNGAFAAGHNLAFVRRPEIKANFRRLIDMMFSSRAHDARFYPSIATHDTDLHRYALDVADSRGWRADEFEFEMLLGVRATVAEALASEGRRVRAYVPFGRDWWPHAVRRVGESPRNGWMLLRSLVASDA